MKLWLSWILNWLLDFVFPPFCVNCQKIGSLLCDCCYEKIEFFCQPLNLKIPDCQLDTLIAACQYRGPIKALIKALKYQSVLEAGKIGGQLLYYCSWPPTDIDCLTAVPLHPQRQAQRGFNQAEIMAKTLAEKLDKPYLNLLTRKSNTPQQAKLKDKTARQTQLKDQIAFNHLASLKNQKLEVDSVLLIDDVVTTGSTLNECAKVLKCNGVKKVYGLCLAHGL